MKTFSTFAIILFSCMSLMAQVTTFVDEGTHIGMSSYNRKFSYPKNQVSIFRVREQALYIRYNKKIVATINSASEVSYPVSTSLADLQLKLNDILTISSTPMNQSDMAVIRALVSTQIKDSLSASRSSMSAYATNSSLTDTSGMLKQMVRSRLRISDTTGRWLSANYQPPIQQQADWSATTGTSFIKNKPPIPSIPSNISAFNNDVNYVVGNGTAAQYISGTGAKVAFPIIPVVPTVVSAFTNDAGYTTPGSSATFTNKSGNISQWTNNAGYVVGNGTTDQYIRGDGSKATMPVNTPYTAGTGISISSGVISTTSLTINNAPARPLNTSFQISMVKPSWVSYTVSCAAVLSGSALVYLEVSANNTTWTTINSCGLNSAAILLNQSFNVQGVVPAGWYARLRSSTTGLGSTTTFTSGQEAY